MRRLKDMGKRKTYFILFILFLLITTLFATLYRNYIYSRDLYDFNIANVFPNIGAVLTSSFLFMALANYKKYEEEVTVIISSVIGLIVYEFIQIILPYSVFDWKDIVGTIIGGILAYIVHYFVYYK